MIFFLLFSAFKFDEDPRLRSKIQSLEENIENIGLPVEIRKRKSRELEDDDEFVPEEIVATKKQKTKENKASDGNLDSLLTKVRPNSLCFITVTITITYYYCGNSSLVLLCRWILPS